jgi:hypothetical protein
LAEKRILLTRTQSKSLEKLLDMLCELRQIGLDVETGCGPRLVKRSAPFTPYVKAVASNLSSFFVHASFAEMSRLLSATESWITRSRPNYSEFKKGLSEKAREWMQLGRLHPDGLRFVARHLLNVVKLWPHTKVQPPPKAQLAVDNKKVVRKLRELAKKQ